MKHPTLSKKWIFWGINGLLALLAVVSALLCVQVCTTLPTLSAAETWAGESEQPFAQLACFLPESKLVNEEDILRFRQALNKKLTEAAMEAPENGSLYSDAYSGKGRLSVTGPRGNSEVVAVGVGGDFFRFHPLPLRSGNYLTPMDLMQDRVLLDEELAWKLFGGIDIAGLSVTIGNADYYVAGVVSREEDKYSALAYSDGAGMFMFYSTLSNCIKETGINCYEIVLPNPIGSYGKNMLTESFPVNDGIIVENSSRYSFGNLLSVIADFGQRSMGTRDIIYPYWENAVRMTEDYASLLLIFAVLFALMPVVCVTITLIRFVRKTLKRTASAVKSKVSEGIEQHRENNWQKTTEKRDQ